MNTVLGAVLALLLAQEKSEAEELFQKMEGKLVAAKTVSLSLEGTVEPMKLKLTGGLRLGEGNLVHLQLEGTAEGKTDSALVVSDGKTRRMLAGGKASRDFATPETFGRLVRTCFARAGFLGTIDNVDTEDDAQADPAAAYVPTGLKLGVKEKVGERDAQAVQFMLKKGREPEEAEVTLWIDSATHLPLKRTMKKGTRTLTEHYVDLNLDEKIDPAKFELPKESK
jgi:outer membrane lipoprotein-sorting protein